MFFFVVVAESAVVQELQRKIEAVERKSLFTQI